MAALNNQSLEAPADVGASSVASGDRGIMSVSDFCSGFLNSLSRLSLCSIPNYTDVYMVPATGTASKVVLVMGLAAFLFLGFLGISHSSMAMGPDGNMGMTNCPLMSGHAVVCNMNSLEHIAAWQSAFTTTLRQKSSDLFALLLTALALAFVLTRLLWPKPEPKLAFAYAIVAQRESNLPPPLLQELFSSGILNSKRF